MCIQYIVSILVCGRIEANRYEASMFNFLTLEIFTFVSYVDGGEYSLFLWCVCSNNCTKGGCFLEEIWLEL